MRPTILAAILTLPAVAWAQAPSTLPRATGAVETSILELDVVVTDRDGRPVSGLQPSDFEVRIGGKPAAISNFYERRPPAPGAAGSPPAALPGASAAPGTGPAAVRPPRHVVLFLDRLRLIEKWKADATFAGLRAILDQTVVAPGDDAMIVTWNRAVGTVVPFTSDRAALERVLAREERLSRRPLEEESQRRQLEDEAAWFQSLPKTGVSSGVEVSQRAAAAEAYAQMRAKANALKAVFSTLGGLPGRKVVVHASHRFSDLAGLEFFLTGPVTYGSIPSDAREFNAHGIVESVAEAANANGVTLYTMFPPGWPDEAQVLSAASSRNSNPKIDSPVEGARGDMIVQNEAAALEPVALRTGGTFALGYKEAPALAPRIVADLDFAYSLGVEAPGRQGRKVARRGREDEGSRPQGPRPAHDRREITRGARAGPRPREPLPAGSGHAPADRARRVGGRDAEGQDDRLADALRPRRASFAHAVRARGERRVLGLRRVRGGGRELLGRDAAAAAVRRAARETRRAPAGGTSRTSCPSSSPRTRHASRSASGTRWAGKRASSSWTSRAER